MNEKKFDPKKLEKLNNPKRLIDIPPEYIWSRLNPGKPDVMVDIGAGTAFFSIAFLQYAKTATVYACDISDILIQWMKENVCPMHPGIVPVKTGENAVPLEDGIADLVFMINLHHELDDPSGIIAESFRILKPTGAIFIVDWKKEEMPEGPPLQIRYLPERVAEQMETAGFGQVRIFNELPKHFMVAGKRE